MSIAYITLLSAMGQAAQGRSSGSKGHQSSPRPEGFLAGTGRGERQDHIFAGFRLGRRLNHSQDKANIFKS